MSLTTTRCDYVQGKMDFFMKAVKVNVAINITKDQQIRKPYVNQSVLFKEINLNFKGQCIIVTEQYR